MWDILIGVIIRYQPYFPIGLYMLNLLPFMSIAWLSYRDPNGNSVCKTRMWDFSTNVAHSFPVWLPHIE